MALRFVYLPRSEKEMRAVPEPDRARIARRIEAYVADPDSPQHDVKALVNTSPRLRLRVGNWRVLFELEGDTMHIHRVLHRREAYR
jgi:mRNA interferase RelE/StbE